MNKKQYKKWRKDAKKALSKLYGKFECETILRWYDNATEPAEVALLGQKKFDILCELLNTGAKEGAWDSYHTKMSLVFLFAPLVLKNVRNGGRQADVLEREVARLKERVTELEEVNLTKAQL